MKLQAKTPDTEEISAEAVSLFQAMEEIVCTCARRKNYYDYQLCPGHEEWWRLHGLLWSEMKCKPWEWPVTKVEKLRRALEAAQAENASTDTP
jgi:hypothetical protein